MNRFDPSTADVHAALAAPASLGSHQLTRRYFLQAAAAAGGATMIPAMFADMAGAASPLKADEGVVVIVWMEGGNDGLNTVVPTDNGTYYDLRGSTAIAPSAALGIGNGRGLHPELGYVQALFQQGDVAIIDGVGDPDNDLSHFESAARWMDGRDHGGLHTSGWVGRYLDGLGGNDPFHGVHIGRSVPLQMQGVRRTATGVPVRPGGIFDPSNASDVDQRQMAALDAMASGSTGLGHLGDALAQAGRSSLAVASRLAPAYNPELPDGDLAPDMMLAARLINANLGLRVINVSYGDFDGHAGHPAMHRDRMREFNQGLQAFHQTLDRRFADRTMVLTLSEFGRRPKANNSSGTDHGSASTLLAIGPGVVGGFHGSFPSLTALDNRRNQVPTVDFRSVYANVLDTWLGADASEVLGGNHAGLALLGSPGMSSGNDTTRPVPVANGRSQIMRLYLAYFRRLPDPAGLDYWRSRQQAGVSLAQISQTFSESPEFTDRYGPLANAGFVDQVYRNVLDRSPDSGGRNYWIERLGAGITRGEMMIGFSESQEFIDSSAPDLFDYDANGPVARLYRAYFLRRPDAAGLAYWNDQDIPLVSISEAFAASDEFADLYGTLSNQAFVEQIYNNVMGREPDEGGRRYWTSVLYGGMRRGSVMLNFSESPEYIERFRTL